MSLSRVITKDRTGVVTQLHFAHCYLGPSCDCRANGKHVGRGKARNVHFSGIANKAKNISFVVKLENVHWLTTRVAVLRDETWDQASC